MKDNKLKINNKKWKPVVINGAVFNEGFEDLIGIEECTDYELINNQNIKRKLSKEVADEPSKKKQKKSKKCEVDIAPSTEGSTTAEIDEQTDVDLTAWKVYGLSENLLKGIRDQGFEYPTEIQTLTLPPAILGRKDILGAAETGSGKTLAFGLPILNAIIEMKSDESLAEDNPLFAIILTPTRELAIQIKNHLTAAAKYTGIHIGVLVGGMAVVKQERVLSKCPEIIVATPGRLWELVQLGYEHLLEIDKIRFLVIDETDRMLERGHFQELQSILEKINGNEEAKKLRQNFVFSATLTLTHDLPKHILKKKRFKKNVDMTAEQKLKKIINSLGIHDPKVVDITKGIGLSENLSEGKINCLIEEKDYYVYYFLQKHPGKTIIFCNSIGCVKRLATILTLLDCKPLPLHASMQQKQRLKNLERFRDRENSLLIATDVAARGLDIPCVDNVLHYQTPRTSESYVHRSGRTARATKEGLTLLIIDASEIRNYINVCKTLNKSEDLPNFPIEQSYFDAVKERVNLAREVDKLQLQVRKTSAEIGWFEKAAKEMDIIIDNVSLNHDSKDRAKCKKLYDIKRKQLCSLLEKPIFPARGISGKYPLLNDASKVDNWETTENAIDTMKKSVENKKKDTKKIVKYYKPKENKNKCKTMNKKNK